MRKAFTLIELLVVIFIISLLMAIILPAVQMAREAARVAKCTNNQKQIATALQHYESTQGRLPGWRDFITVSATDSDGEPYEVAAHASWVFSILPYIEQTDLYERLKTGDIESSVFSNRDQEIPSIAILHCPSHVDTPMGRATNYVVNGGAVDDFSDTDGYITFDISVANGPFLDRAAIFAAETIDRSSGRVKYTQGGLIEQGSLRRHQSTVARLSDITKMDGTAHTLMTAENAQRGFWISEELYHFYHTPVGEVSSVAPGDYIELPDGRFFAPIPGPVHTIEGSVAFCWPRFYAVPENANENMRICYPREIYNNPSNPRQGFTAAQIATADDPRFGAYQPLGRDPYDGGRIPAFLGMFHRKTFNQWYQSARPSAYHVSIVVASYCDGNVRKINHLVDERVFVHMMVAGAPRSDAGWSFGNTPGGERNFLEGRIFDGRWLD